MDKRTTAWAGTMLALATMASGVAPPAHAASIGNPTYAVTNLGTGEVKGISNDGRAFGTARGKAYTTTGLFATTPVANGQAADPKTTVAGVGDGYSVAYGINDSGQVVGSLPINGAQRAFRQSNGQTTTIEPLAGGTFSGASAINASGAVVGQSGTSGGGAHGFLYTNGATKDLGTLGGAQSDAKAINDAGLIAGSAQKADGTYRAAVSDHGAAWQDLGTLPGGANSWAFAINKTGQVAGYGEVAGGKVHAFRATNGTMTDLGTLPGDRSSYAAGINDAGNVVGWSTDELGSYRAFLAKGETLYDLNNYLPADSEFKQLNGATGINNAGKVVGWGTLTAGGQASFAMDLKGLADLPPLGEPIPSPEPASIVAFGAAALALGVLRRRRSAAQR